VGRLGKILALTILLLILVPIRAHCQDAIVQVTIDESDAREITGYLRELKDTRKQNEVLQSLLEQQRELMAERKKLTDDKIAFAEKQRDFYKAEADKYQVQLEALTKKGGAKVFFCKLFTLGIARCQ